MLRKKYAAFCLFPVGTGTRQAFPPSAEHLIIPIRSTGATHSEGIGDRLLRECHLRSSNWQAQSNSLGPPLMTIVESIFLNVPESQIVGHFL